MKQASSFAVGGFLIGFIFGIIFWNGIGIAAAQQEYWKHAAIVKVGDFLDTDIVYLKAGKWFKGRILAETSNEVELRTDKEVLKIPREDVNKIDYNAYSRYLKELW